MIEFKIYPLYIETFRDASYSRDRLKHHKALRFSRHESAWTRKQVTAHAHRLGIYQALQANCRFPAPLHFKSQHMSYNQFRQHVLNKSEE
jgi:hypothetical protein